MDGAFSVEFAVGLLVVGLQLPSFFLHRAFCTQLPTNAIPTALLGRHTRATSIPWQNNLNSLRAPSAIAATNPVTFLVIALKSRASQLALDVAKRATSVETVPQAAALAAALELRASDAVKSAISRATVPAMLEVMPLAAAAVVVEAENATSAASQDTLPVTAPKVEKADMAAEDVVAMEEEDAAAMATITVVPDPSASPVVAMDTCLAIAPLAKSATTVVNVVTCRVTVLRSRAAASECATAARCPAISRQTAPTKRCLTTDPIHSFTQLIQPLSQRNDFCSAHC
ncbi:hypothetical protein BT63DRAFT_411015 [Microthyrium microscopicum]|uniref:Uncharacterized protein n=1 Tax=Microthyrium microscopicum TaxID=703497 RepID=A0A6A6UJI9_9PEZI|nr:hypothetical protein BT63DRAFT_411015 [Microthyrium microscopicum]